MQQAFDSYDKDGNGVLDVHEVTDLLTNHFRESGVSKKPSSADVQAFFDKLDDDHSNEIEFEEFKLFLIENMKTKLIKPLQDYLIGEGFNLEEDGAEESLQKKWGI